MGRVFAAFFIFVLSTSTACSEEIHGFEEAISQQTTSLDNSPNFAGIFCVFGVILTPMVSIAYMFLKCLIKENSQTLTCVATDLAIGLTSFLTIAGTFCILDPPREVNTMLDEMAEMLVEYILQ
jgi:hypothetical protein